MFENYQMVPEEGYGFWRTPLYTEVEEKDVPSIIWRNYSFNLGSPKKVVLLKSPYFFDDEYRRKGKALDHCDLHNFWYSAAGKCIECKKHIKPHKEKGITWDVIPDYVGSGGPFYYGTEKSLRTGYCEACAKKAKGQENWDTMGLADVPNSAEPVIYGMSTEDFVERKYVYPGGKEEYLPN